jgi:lipoprotein-releasing system ATP-binding protein
MSDTMIEGADSAENADSADPPPVLFLHGIDRHYRQGDVTLDILKGAELAIWPGQSIALVAPSGAGKSTLLHVAGLLEQPDAGEVYIDQVATTRLTDAERTRIRRVDIGFVYQFHHLLPEFTALENVAMPLLIRRMNVAAARGRARAILDRVGLGQRLTHRPDQLSGGERQRAAVARALVTEPKIVLADEPTGNLDGTNAEAVFALMLELNRELGTSLIVVTHDMRLAGRMERIFEIERGILRERPLPAARSQTGS